MTDSRVSLVPFRKVQDATLLIQHANSTTDRGHYNCTAESLYGSSTNYGLSHVRIKSWYPSLPILRYHLSSTKFHLCYVRF